MSILILIIPVFLILCGLWLTQKPPKEINRISGYRTKASMKNQESWDYAQKYCGKMWLGLGIVLLLVSGILVIFVPELKKKFGFNISCMLAQTVLSCLSILPIEKALKERKGDE